LNHDVWVLTRANNAASIEKALRAEPDLRLTPIYLDLPSWARWWKRGGRGVRLYYLLWQAVARRRAKQLHRDVGFDIAHHVTFAMDWLPAGVVGIDGLPAVWGPVGGAAPFPWQLRAWLGPRGMASELARALAGSVGRKVFGDWAARRAAVVVAQNDEVARRFLYSSAIVEPHAVAALVRSVKELDTDDTEGRRTAIFVGRLTPWKGIHLAVETIAQPASAGWSLHVFGAGKEHRRAQRLATRLHVTERVQFLGQRPRDEVLAAYQSADALLLPTMHDSAPFAVAEAIAAGLSVVCLDLCGPAVMVRRSHGGVLIEPSRHAPVELAKALRSVASNRSTPIDPSGIDVRRLDDVITRLYSSAVGATA